ncbi:hypothetical protein TNCV_4788241 [Trichonephila clavipes]|nr:hypothetical protein TNCV_4788241 [Trichonephila clavipes]
MNKNDKLRRKFAFRHRKFCFSSCRSLRLPHRLDSSSTPSRISFSELISFACLRLHSLCTSVIFDSASNPFDLDRIMATSNDLDWTQNGIINNVHIPSSPSTTSDEFAATSAELGNIHTALLAAKERMNLPLFRLPTSIEALDPLIKKVEEQRAHLIPVDSTPKETVPYDTTLNSSSKRTLKYLRLKTDKKRLIDDDWFQTPDKKPFLAFYHLPDF